MKIWEIKAQSLRLMFADTDMEFNYNEFADGTVENNPNTRDKLVRMEDSIRRGIDTYYSIFGEFVQVAEFPLMTAVVGGSTVLLNKIDCSTNAAFGYPTRVDVKAYDEDGVLRREFNQTDFSFDPITKQIFFYENNYATFSVANGVTVLFSVWYRRKKLNIPVDPNELTYDLDLLYIPEEVQRHLAYFVKSELFEEDEPKQAEKARSYFFSFLYGLKKPFSNVQTKVKRAKVFDKS